MSFLEQWFYDEIICKLELDKKYDIVSEFGEYPYFIDFAFVNEKIAVELDGGFHFINQKSIEKDINRDKILKEKGWTLYHIAYFENKNIVEQDFLKFLNKIEKQRRFESCL